ncbi:hypothetical protein ABEV74_11065 [Paenibacillus cisolokensis]|uniref:hypothetical protein n=1 Tax=Paenibacillus cisolokensis TaxID=1658519 RepID=UPI003D2821B9
MKILRKPAEKLAALTFGAALGVAFAMMVFKTPTPAIEAPRAPRIEHPAKEELET